MGTHLAHKGGPRKWGGKHRGAGLQLEGCVPRDCGPGSPQGKTELDPLRPAAAQTLPLWTGSLDREFAVCVQNTVIMVTKNKSRMSLGHLRTMIKARWSLQAGCNIAEVVAADLVCLSDK